MMQREEPCVAEKEWLKVAKEFRGLDRRFHVMEKKMGGRGAKAW